MNQSPVAFIAVDDRFGQIADSLVQVGQWLDRRGWVPATGGNFSARLNADEIAITVSGCHKGELTPANIMRVDYHGASLDGQKPSAETLLHTGLYKIFPAVNAIVHTHPRQAVIHTLLHRDDHVALSGYELLKAFPGIQTHDTTITLPVFENAQDMPALQLQIDAWYQAHPEAPPAYLVRGHGLTVGGRDIITARYITEAIEELLAYETGRKKA